MQLIDFIDSIKSMPWWTYLLIQHYKDHSSSDSILYHISNNSVLLISADGSTTYNKSGDSWIIVLQDGTKLISGSNLEFGRHIDINLYHSKIYASLASLTIFECYCDCFSLPLNNVIHADCDNKSYVTK